MKNIFDTKNKRIITANYSKDLTSKAYLHKLFPAEADAPDVSVAVLWNARELKITLVGQADTLSITSGSYQRKLDLPCGEIVIPMNETGFSITDADTLLPLSIKAEKNGKSSLLDGFIRLCEYEIVFSMENNSGKSFPSFSADYRKALADPDADLSKYDFDYTGEGRMLRLTDRHTEGMKPLPFTRIELSGADVSGIVHTDTTVIDLDITINSFPVMDYFSVCGIDSTYGLMLVLSENDGKDSLTCGIQHTPVGLVFLVNKGIEETLALGRFLGDSFHLTVKWDRYSHRITAFVDGNEIGSISVWPIARPNREAGRLTLYWARSKYAPTSHDGDLDVTITNMTVSNDRTSPARDTLKAEMLYGEKSFTTSGDDKIYLAPERLFLLDSLEGDRYGTSASLVWSSSNKAVLSDSGVFTSPETCGELATLTATALSGGTAAFTLPFTFFKEGKAPNQSVLVAEKDENPFFGEAHNADCAFVFDKDNGSIVYDMGELTTIRGASLAMLSETPDYLSKSFVSLYYSADNKSYHYIKDFSILRHGDKLYFYNFAVKARYLKLHSLARKTELGFDSIYNSAGKMMKAWSCDAPLLAEGGFAHSVTLTLKNDTDKTELDRICRYKLSALGIDKSLLRADLADIRIKCGERYLPQYLCGDILCFRVLSIPAGGSAELTFLYGNKNAESVFDGNEVFEVQYGARYSKPHKGAWRNSVAEMPDGSLLLMGGIGGNGIYYERSVDGGHTWADSVMAGHIEGFSDGGAFLVDRENNIVFYFAHQYNLKEQWCKLKIMRSYDSGYTWEKAVEVDDQADYLISYSDAIKLSCFDGDGPNVDYVFTTGMMREKRYESFTTTAIYSRDGGKTWQQSTSRINVPNDLLGLEMGLSEETVYEQKDGTLILYARCQYPECVHFAIAYSYDHGVTWTNVDHYSSIYTPNTNPIIAPLDGTPVLLWGGNNSLGGSSYKRFPLNMAYSLDDCESFIGIQDASFQTPLAAVTSIARNITNPDLTFYKYHGIDYAYLIAPADEFRISDLKRFLYNTKGVFDSFEAPSYRSEGWVNIAGEPYVTELGATDGRYALYIPEGVSISRSVSYTEKGELSFDLYADTLGESLSMELQSAYNLIPAVSGPVFFKTDSRGAVYTRDTEKNAVPTGLSLKSGQNHITLTFDSASATATLTVNGDSASIGYNKAMGEAICFMNIWCAQGTNVALDKVILIKE